MSRVRPDRAHAYERATTHDELLTFVEQIGHSCTIARVETIGTTTQGRAIPMVVVSTGGPAVSKLRVLVFCSQHGNEPSGKEAALMLLEKIARGELDPSAGADRSLARPVDESRWQ